MKSLTKHLIEESIINKYDSGYSGISKVLSSNKIKSIDFVFDVSGSTYGVDYKKWTNQADMIIKQAGQWGIRERDCNFWEASDGEVRHLRLGQIPNRGGSTTSLDAIINELNPNPYSLVVLFTDFVNKQDFIGYQRFRCPMAIVTSDPDLAGHDYMESKGIYFIHDNDLGTQAPYPGIVKASGSGRGGMHSGDIKLVRNMMEEGYVMGEDGVIYVVSPESILLVYDENVYSSKVVADVVKTLERQGVEWKYRSDKEALRANRGYNLIPGSPAEGASIEYPRKPTNYIY